MHVIEITIILILTHFIKKCAFETQNTMPAQQVYMKANVFKKQITHTQFSLIGMTLRLL
jgi:hypothetical protein